MLSPELSSFVIFYVNVQITGDAIASARRENQLGLEPPPLTATKTVLSISILMLGSIPNYPMCKITHIYYFSNTSL